MDDKNLKKILSNLDVPKADENAKKRAVNLAVSEFEQFQKEKEKKSQGFPILSRLMGITNGQDRRDPMESRTRKRLMYGGLATALSLVLVVSTSYTVMQEKAVSNSAYRLTETRNVLSGEGWAEIQNSDQELKGASSKVKEHAPNRSTAQLDLLMGLVERAEKNERRVPKKVEALREENSRRAENAARSAASAIPMQVDPIKGQLPKVYAGEGKVRSVAPPMVLADMEEDVIAPSYYQDEGRDQFEDFKINPVKQVAEEPVSTFSVDVDTASYSFVRSQLNNGILPAKDAVRVEEMINYFDYDYPLPETREKPFKPTVTIMDSPWAEGKKLMHVGIKGFDIEAERPKSNLVFLLDVSGSMNQPNKLPLLVSSLKMLVDNLTEDDTISIVVYAGAAGTVLEPTKATNKAEIYNALNKLRAGGSTAGAAGINLAYQLAEENFDKNAVNRVILATDGDFNVGITNREELKDFVERKRESGIFLSVFGFGQGNYNDHLMQTLAQNGNGVAAYIDTLSEARKVLVEEASSSLFPIAKDVKIQVEFNPKAVSEYRLVGYETRALNREDFNNDKIDAGDIGAGHKVTAIYEITLAGSDAHSVDPLRYGEAPEVEEASEFANEYAFLKMRYKLPTESKSKLITTPVTKSNDIGLVQNVIEDGDTSLTDDIGFSIAVAGFAQLLKGGQHTGDLTYDDIIELANETKGDDPFGYRAEFVQLVRMAKAAR